MGADHLKDYLGGVRPFFVEAKFPSAHQLSAGGGRSDGLVEDGDLGIGDVDYSLPPGNTGRRVQARVSTSEVVTAKDPSSPVTAACASGRWPGLGQSTVRGVGLRSR
jgi:hypothetical protein